VLTEADGTVIGHPLPIGGFGYSIVSQDVGSLDVSLGREWAAALDFETRLEVWRSLPPLAAVLVRSYFVEAIEEKAKDAVTD
jgi:hypothetical protein